MRNISSVITLEGAHIAIFVGGTTPKIVFCDGSADESMAGACLSLEASGISNALMKKNCYFSYSLKQKRALSKNIKSRPYMSVGRDIFLR